MSMAESPALTLRTRRCVDCQQTKPWADFYPRKTWPDGTVRHVESRCKQCSIGRLNRYAATHPRKHRDRAYYESVKADPERYAIRLEHSRSRHRRNRGTRPENYRGEYRLSIRVGGRHLDPEPFAAWLHNLAPSNALRASVAGLDESQVRRYLACRLRPSEGLVERCLMRAEGDSTRFNEIYPLGEADGQYAEGHPQGDSSLPPRRSPSAHTTRKAA